MVPSAAELAAEAPRATSKSCRRRTSSPGGARRRSEDEGGGPGAAGDPADRDELFREAAETCIQTSVGSTSLLQRKLRIGYGRAARIIDQLHEVGILGPSDGSKPREVLIGFDQLDEYCQ